MGAGVDQLPRCRCQVLRSFDDFHSKIERHRRDQRLVTDAGAVGEMRNLVLSFDSNDRLVE